MALTIADFKRPKGRLTSTWFVDDLDAILTELLSQATTATSDEDAQTAFVYHKAFSVLVDDLMHKPATRHVDDITEQMLADQLKHFRSERDSYKSRYDALAGVAGGIALTAIGFDT